MGIEGVTPGTAFTLVTPKDSSFAVDLARNLQLSGQPIPEDLLRLAQGDPKWSKIHGSGGGGGRGGGGRGGLGFGPGGGPRAMTSEMLAKQGTGPASISHPPSKAVSAAVSQGDCILCTGQIRTKPELACLYVVQV